MNTLAEELALAVLRGDRVAAYALADNLLEERNNGFNKLAEAARITRQHPTAHDGYEVYAWPEFKKFCDRAGILWDLRTINMIIYIDEGKPLRIVHQYSGSDITESSLKNSVNKALV